MNIILRLITLTNRFPSRWKTLTITILSYLCNDINKFSSSIKQRISLFVNDTCLTVLGKNIQELNQIANEQLSLLDEWFRANRLTMNTDKTKYMVFKHNISNQDLSIKLHGNVIERTSSYKYLGLILDSKLNFKGHITLVLNKIRKRIPLLIKIKNKLNFSTKLKVYYAFNYPHFLYGIEIYSNTSNYNIKKLQNLQNRVVKYIFYNKKSSIEDLFQTHKLLDIKNISKIQKIKSVFNYKNCKLPNQISENYDRILNDNDIERVHNLRNRNNFPHIRYNTNLGANHSYSNTKFWNILPNRLKLISNAKLLLKKLRHYFLH